MQQKNDVIGVIYGNVGSTEFNFTVNRQGLKKFDYITAPHKEGDMLAVDLQTGKVEDKTSGSVLQATKLPEFIMEILGNGGLIEHLKRRIGTNE